MNSTLFALIARPVHAAVLAVLILSATGVAAEDLHVFKRIQLSDQFWSEGATFGDLNNDGANDIISGPWWWQGPDFSLRHGRKSRQEHRECEECWLHGGRG